MTSLPTKPQRRLGKVIDTAVQDYITSMREVGGVVNINICMVATEGIVASCDQGLLAHHGCHIQITQKPGIDLSLLEWGMSKGNAQMPKKSLFHDSVSSKQISLLIFKQR